MDNVYEYVQSQMQALPRKTWPEIAAAAAVPMGTVYRYAHGYTRRPAHEPLVRLAAVLREREQAQ